MKLSFACYSQFREARNFAKQRVFFRENRNSFRMKISRISYERNLSVESVDSNYNVILVSCTCTVVTTLYRHRLLLIKKLYVNRLLLDDGSAGCDLPGDLLHQRGSLCTARPVDQHQNHPAASPSAGRREQHRLVGSAAPRHGAGGRGSPLDPRH